MTDQSGGRDAGEDAPETGELEYGLAPNSYTAHRLVCSKKTLSINDTDYTSIMHLLIIST
jgi:hypothetical protein